MSRRILAVAVVLASATQAGGTPRPVVEVRSLMPSFWSAISAPDPTAQAQAVEKVIAANPGLYGPVVKPLARTDLLGYLKQIAPLRPAMEQLGHDLEQQLPKSISALEHDLGTLPPMTVFIAPSLFTSNGQVRMVKGKPVVAFGPDVQAYVVKEFVKAAPPYDVRALVGHEVFHAYHYGMNPAIGGVANRLFATTDKPPLYLNLWIEGLATCASMRVDGDGSVANALMSDDMPTKLPAILPKLAAELRTKMHSSTEQDYRDYFWMSGERTDIPKRSAYGVGALVADRVVDQIGLRAAVQLRGKKLERAVAAALGDLLRKDYHLNWNRVCEPTRP